MSGSRNGLTAQLHLLNCAVSLQKKLHEKLFYGVICIIYYIHFAKFPLRKFLFKPERGQDCEINFCIQHSNAHLNTLHTFSETFLWRIQAKQKRLKISLGKKLSKRFR